MTDYIDTLISRTPDRTDAIDGDRVWYTPVSTGTGTKVHGGCVVISIDGKRTVRSACTPPNGGRNPNGKKPYMPVDAKTTCKRCANW